jgi:N-acyl-D-amino-acid deacylase
MTMRPCFVASAFGLIFCSLCPRAALAQDGQVIATGAADPALASFDRMMFEFMEKHQVPGAQLAVTRHGRLVYARGFGYADKDAREPVRPASLFRIASVTKPLTSAAVMQLVQHGKLRLDARMVDVLGLSLRGANPDRRLENVTIYELLQHRGGWDRDKSFDPMFRPILIAREMGVEPPAGPHAIIGYMMGMPLQFPPGQHYAYSNFGYCVLGRVIEKVSGETYEHYVQRNVLAPLKIHRMRIGHTLAFERAPHEVRYYDSKNRIGNGVVRGAIGKKVPIQYGGWYLEAMDAHGGWIATAVDLVRFASAFDLPEYSPILSAKEIRTIFGRPPGPAGGPPKKKGSEVYYGCGWEVRMVGPGRINTWHTGLLDGTSSILVRRFDGLNWAVLFNMDADSNSKVLADLIDARVHQAADEVQNWPDVDLFPQLLADHERSAPLRSAFEEARAE